MIDHVLNDDSTLEQVRPLLLRQAYCQMGSRLKQKLDAEDLVQQTLLDAYRHRHQFRGRSEGEISAWLRTILHHNLLDVAQKFQTAKRDFSSEVPLRKDVHRSALRADHRLTDDREAPDLCAERHEEIENMLSAVRRLTAAQREAIQYFYLEDASLVDVAQRMNRSEGSVSSLIYRGVSRLRTVMEKVENDCPNLKANPNE
jgi:RNA polymerase sigma-70 factor (ECF subfamily)